jgi:hypothetical protein
MRIYAVTFEDVTVSAAQDFLELTPADDKPVRLIYAELGQNTEVADAAEEQLRIKIIRGHATSGSGGSAPTPVPMHPSDTAAGATAEVNNTTIASTGTAVDLYAGTWNVRSNWIWQPTPEQYIYCSEGAGIRLVVRLMAAPADALDVSGTFYFQEMV